MYFLVRDGGKGAGEKTSKGGQQRDERHLPTVIRLGFRYASRTLVPFWPPEAGTLVLNGKCHEGVASFSRPLAFS